MCLIKVCGIGLTSVSFNLSLLKQIILSEDPWELELECIHAHFGFLLTKNIHHNSFAYMHISAAGDSISMCTSKLLLFVSPLMTLNLIEWWIKVLWNLRVLHRRQWMRISIDKEKKSSREISEAVETVQAVFKICQITIRLIYSAMLLNKARNEER